MSKEKKNKNKKTDKKSKYNTPNIRHKYLNEIGIKSNECCVFNTTDADDVSRRLDRLMKQRKEYGFDERETWALNSTLAGWLYSHLRMYKDIGGKVVNLEYHKFEIPVIKRLEPNEIKYIEGSTFPERYYKEVLEEHTQEECIDLAIEYLEYYLKNGDAVKFEKEAKATEKCQCAMKIVAEILPALWW